MLATKFGMAMGGDDGEPRGSRAYARRAVEASLARLRTDRIDLFYYHEPDGVTPLAETVGALRELVDEGKIRTYGMSNLDAAQLREAAAHGDERFAALQNEYSLLEREAEEEILPLCRELGIGFVPYYPLASGLLTGKFRRGAPAPEGTRLAGRPDRLAAARLRPDRGARGVRARARPHPARARHRRARRAARRRVGDRRRDATPTRSPPTPRPASGGWARTTSPRSRER